jgi:EAL domain-containing protein (putative c-di-GMP-specific phosphodiesterase class I)
VSVGASAFPRDGDSFEVLLRNADAAMHRVKEEGRNGFHFYADVMTREMTERVEIEHDLRIALDLDELEIHFQPQIALADNRVTGVEALMRWNHRKRGAISPVRFIPVAEELGLIHALGNFALRQGCERLQQWDKAGLPPLRLAVNASARQFRSPDLLDNVRSALEHSGLDPRRLELELTEAVLVENQDETVGILRRFKALGVQIAVDDFGTGYSSLSYLSRLPVDCLKIDRSFVHRISERGHDAAIVQAIISLAHALGMRVVAEGVETAEELDFLRAHDCEEVQGYLLSKPVHANSIPALASKPLMPAR